MRVILLNQFAPPSQPPTAKLMGDLAAALQRAGHQVSCIGSANTFGAARGVWRLLRDARAHLRIAWAVIKAGRCDWIVAFSDPTALPVTARMLATLKGARLAHWAMDVYPQTAIALGAVRESLLTRCIAAAMHFAYRGCDFLVVLDKDMLAEIAAYHPGPIAVLPPWPPEVSSALPHVAPHHGRRWLYSGSLGRAHEYETLLRAQKILEERGSDWELCFQGGGSSRNEAEALAARLGLKKCRWVGHVPDEELLPALLSADVLIATQRPETRGLLWPSKLAIMKHLNLPIAWVGPVEGAIAEWLRQLRNPCGFFAPGAPIALADWLESLPQSQARSQISEIREKVCAERSAGTQWWLDRLTQGLES